MTDRVYLQAYLEPLACWLEDEAVTDILVNRPGEVWVEATDRPLARHAAPELSEAVLQRLARQIAAASHQAVSREHPLLSATLPGGERVQVVAPPATREGLALAVRRHNVTDLSIAELGRRGAFASAAGDAAEARRANDRELLDLLQAGDLEAFLRGAVERRKTIVVSGGTGSGKTTLVNALIKQAGADERLVVIEDAPEIRLNHPNSLGLVAVRGEHGEAQVDADSLLAAALRLRPDRILLGELRGGEAFAFLRAINSGHPGSITTIHADSPEGALDQIALLALMAGANLDWPRVREYVSRVVDVVVQMERRGGLRRVTEVVFRPAA